MKQTTNFFCHNIFSFAAHFSSMLLSSNDTDEQLTLDSLPSSNNDVTSNNDTTIQDTSLQLNASNDISTVSASETPRHRIRFDSGRVNLESHQLLWGDTNVNGGELSKFTVTVDELRKIVDYTKVFDDVEKCHLCILHTGDT